PGMSCSSGSTTSATPTGESAHQLERRSKSAPASSGETSLSAPASAASGSSPGRTSTATQSSFWSIWRRASQGTSPARASEVLPTPRAPTSTTAGSYSSSRPSRPRSSSRPNSRPSAVTGSGARPKYGGSGTPYGRSHTSSSSARSPPGETPRAAGSTASSRSS